MNLRFPRRFSFFACFSSLLIGIVGGSNTGYAGVIVAEHSGAADPLSQGWSVDGGIPSGLTVGSITESAAFGSLDAWFVDDNSSAAAQRFCIDRICQISSWLMRATLAGRFVLIYAWWTSPMIRERREDRCG